MTCADFHAISEGSGGTLLHGRAILFDLDGVLVDSRQCIEHGWREWVESRGKGLPAHRRAIVTSGSPPVAAPRVRLAAVPRPGLLIAWTCSHACARSRAPPTV